ncbi:hypothetical protein L6164_033597 [Bauhinia variegata]|uniref:Uncharacterized protein n=1 Tax=Bauhinia variegata TaxID=167791 RepID=A0ACB9KSD6_BAUVA|nr:hypothetical protein L6164_033597 [Bauhinia variegata]
MESFFFKTTLTQNHTFQDRAPALAVDFSWMFEFLKGMVKPAAATAVVVLAVVLSFWQKLGLEAEMAYAIFRAFLQLSVIGFVLQFIFNQDNAGWIILAYLFMVRFLYSTFILYQYTLIEKIVQQSLQQIYIMKVSFNGNWGLHGFNLFDEIPI